MYGTSIGRILIVQNRHFGIKISVLGASLASLASRQSSLKHESNTF